MAKKQPAQVYLLKITLQHIKPPVWRRVQVKDCTLAKLHDIIQACMGWDDYHLHEFEIGGERYGDPAQWRDDFGGEMEVGNEGKVKLSQLVAQGVKKVKYTYDMGDTWEHLIQIEKVVEAEKGVRYPRCIDGKRACPPEDCGGPWGYGDFLDAIQNPRHERHEELLEWVGGEFDPEAFDIDAVNEELR
jgi:Plasmid pRiA4b ORF-3-like protein